MENIEKEAQECAEEYLTEHTPVSAYKLAYEAGYKRAWEKYGESTNHGITARWNRQDHFCYCSHCFKSALRNDSGKEILSGYCPNCGARMKNPMNIS